MDKTFVLWICIFFKTHLNIDLDTFRDDTTRRYDIDSLLFINWNLVSSNDKIKIDKFAAKHADKFVINYIASGLRCIAEVRGNKRSD